MCRRQFLQQPSSSQTSEELAGAEVDAQVVVSHLREVGRFMRRRADILPITGSGGVLETYYTRIQNGTRNDSTEDNGDEPSLNSGMYS